MSIRIVIPYMGNDDLTRTCVNQLIDTIRDGNTRITLWHNGSESSLSSLDFGFPVEFIQSSQNVGFYYPLLPIYESHSEDIIVMMHNDLFIYEEGWDRRLADAFFNNNQIGLVGLVGSNEIDGAGGRGLGTMLNFRGQGIDQWRGQPASAGKKVTKLYPAAVLDSLFMAFRRECVPLLSINSSIALAHFYDKIWSCRIIESGFKVAVLGIECDHLGGQTLVLDQGYADDCDAWLKKHGYKTDFKGYDPSAEMYFVAERRFLSEYRDVKRMIPLKIDSFK